MALRTLYLHSSPLGACGDSLSSHRLQEEFRARSSQILVGQRVVPSGKAAESRSGVVGGLLSEESMRHLAPNVIFMGGGLFADNRGSWKIHWPMLESWVERGSTLIVGDCGTDEVCRHRSSYNRASRFLRAHPEIVIDSSNAASDGTFPNDRDRQIVCDTRSVVLSEWLRPVLAGIPEVAVRNPAKLESWEYIVAAEVTQTSGNAAPGNQAETEKIPWVFASAAQCGSGYVVFIAGEISADDWIERFPANARWLTNLSELLVAEGERNSARFSSPIRPSFSFLLSNRSANKQMVVRMGDALRCLGAQVWLDPEYPVSGNSGLPAANRGLEHVTHFVLFWSRACLGAPWVERDLPSMVSMAVERQIPMIVIRLDMAPVPKIATDFFRIEALGMSPQELATASIHAARRLERNRN